jgi:hypothetical protein
MASLFQLGRVKYIDCSKERRFENVVDRNMFKGIVNFRTKDLRTEEACMCCPDYRKDDVDTLRICRQCFKWNGGKKIKILEGFSDDFVDRKGHYDDDIIRQYLNMGMSLEGAKSRAWVEDE